MDLQSAIQHLKESLTDPTHKWGCEECKQEHEQLLEWLEDYKRLRSESSWIPCSDRIPDEDSYKWAVGITSTGKCIAFQEHNAYENDTGGISVPTYLAHGSEITNWMPIHEPPKEARHDKN